ncbi:hypothetical protein [Alkalimarinus alittae]|uniref:Bacteriocin n=1 Tax=Alkalimarinus alittae TaxID=2961619 RepID=A0ABY6N1D3_9ALTE|nr:hypothetical protein [Alkalimarinus alittae]UZE95921.1 hypothetical protein NKI27_18025 [Alkalimarinus alittae]
MKELRLNEIEDVSGGAWYDNAATGFTWGGMLGTVGGAAFTGSTIGATRGGLIGGALGFSAGLGYGIGTVGYNAFSNWYYN